MSPNEPTKIISIPPPVDDDPQMTVIERHMKAKDRFHVEMLDRLDENNRLLAATLKAINRLAASVLHGTNGLGGPRKPTEAEMADLDATSPV